MNVGTFCGMRKYRLVLLLKSDLKKDAVEKLSSDIKKWFGEIKDEKSTGLGEKKLAYTIKGDKKGSYLVMEFSADAINADAEKRIQVQEQILRHLLVRMD